MNIVHHPVAGLLYTSKAEAQIEYDKATRAQLEAQAIVAQYRKYLPKDVLAQFDSVEAWFIPNYAAFKNASELSYGNWLKAPALAREGYEAFNKKAQSVLVEKADQIQQDGGGEIKFPEGSGDIPGLPPGSTPWVLAGAVGLALIIGIALASRQK